MSDQSIKGNQRSTIQDVQFKSAKLNDPDDKLLTRQEAARILGVTVKTVDKWANAGDFNLYRHRGEVRFLKSEIIGIWTAMSNELLKRDL